MLVFAYVGLLNRLSRDSSLYFVTDHQGPRGLVVRERLVEDVLRLVAVLHVSNTVRVLEGNGYIHTSSDVDVDAVAGLLVDLERVDLPVGVREGRGVVLHVALAGAGESRAGGVAAPDIASPVTAEGGVEDLKRIPY